MAKRTLPPALRRNAQRVKMAAKGKKGKAKVGAAKQALKKG
jgi:hypothetical protein